MQAASTPGRYPASTCSAPLPLLQDGGLQLGGAELEGGRGQRDPAHLHTHPLSQVSEKPETRRPSHHPLPTPSQRHPPGVGGCGDENDLAGVGERPADRLQSGRHPVNHTEVGGLDGIGGGQVGGEEGGGRLQQVGGARQSCTLRLRILSDSCTELTVYCIIS